MKRLCISCSLVIISYFSFAQDSTSINNQKTRKLPSMDIKALDGRTINTSTFSNNGKPIAICFWATWCKPCIEEHNAIAEVYDDWKKETGVKVISISIDDSRTMNRVAPFVNGKGWDYEVYIDPNGDFKRAMNVNMPPHTFVLNAKGEIVWQHVSYTPGDEKKLYEVIKQVAAGKPISE